MVKYLVEKEGFTVFALESPAVEADRINEYVIAGKNDKRNLVFPFYLKIDEEAETNGVKQG